MNTVHLICLGVLDLARSRQFYLDLGFEQPNNENSDVIVFFDNQGTKLELFPYTELLKDIGLTQEANPFLKTFNGVTHAYNVRSVEEVDEVFSRAQKAGATIIKKPVFGDWGGYSGYFSDPDGYLWECAFGPDWQFDQNDMLVIK